MDKSPNIIPRSAHHLSRALIDNRALKVLYHLHNNGFEAYLVGGCVRDLLLHKHPKDFDIVTNAEPEQLKTLFKNSRIIGRRFRLVHIYFGRHYVEVATFRAKYDEKHLENSQRDGFITRDNQFGSIEEDAWRRDFSVNALYYNIADFSLVDYVGGLADLERRQLHMLGDPEARYREDPVRMLRAIRFAAKLEFNIAPDTAAPIRHCRDWLEQVPPSRLLDEIIKLFHCGHAQSVYQLLKAHDLFQTLFPATHHYREKHPAAVDSLLETLCHDTDARIAADKTISPVYLFAVLLWPAVVERQEKLLPETNSVAQALIEAGFQVMFDQNCVTALPKRFQHSIHQIWRLQYRIERPSARVAERAYKSPRFRAAIDLFKLRVKKNPALATQLDWWKAYDPTLMT